LPSDFYLLLKMIGPVIVLLCFIPYLMRRFQEREDPILTKLKTLDSNIYNVSSDVEVRTKAQTVNIDYVVTSKFGVFAIQVKPFSGTVEGQLNHVMWINKRMGKPIRFPNPLSYNSEAIAVLRSCYDYPDGAYHSLVVFKGKGKFFGNMPNIVRTQNDFIEFILGKENLVLDEDEARKIHLQIRTGKIPNTLKTYSQYLDHARSLVEKSPVAMSAADMEDEVTVKDGA